MHTQTLLTPSASSLSSLLPHLPLSPQSDVSIWAVPLMNAYQI